MFTQYSLVPQQKAFCILESNTTTAMFSLTHNIIMTGWQIRGNIQLSWLGFPCQRSEDDDDDDDDINNNSNNSSSSNNNN